MPCISDYLEPNQRERELTNIRAFQTELKTGKLGEHYGTGMDPDVYDKNLSQEILDKETAMLCKAMQKVEVEGNLSNVSLELQMWWRDHKAADLKRVKAELEAVKDEEDRKKALAKLSAHERKLLGY